MQGPTQITIRPDPSQATGSSSDFFSPGGFGVKDVLDAVNPLQHIPFISTLYEQATGDVASTASKLVGGTLLGGPVGFLISLADVIFEQATGHSVGGAMVAALTGQDTGATTQLASATGTTGLTAATPSSSGTPLAEILPPQTDAAKYAAIGQQAQMQLASAITPGQQQSDRDTLALFGTDAKSAHNSYRKAQFMPYLNDVSTSMVL